MGFSTMKGINLECSGNKVYASDKSKAIRNALYTFRSSQGNPVSAVWIGDEVKVQTDKGKTFLVKNNATCNEI